MSSGTTINNATWFKHYFTGEEICTSQLKFSDQSLVHITSDNVECRHRTCWSQGAGSPSSLSHFSRIIVVCSITNTSLPKGLHYSTPFLSLIWPQTVVVCCGSVCFPSVACIHNIATAFCTICHAWHCIRLAPPSVHGARSWICWSWDTWLHHPIM